MSRLAELRRLAPRRPLTRLEAFRVAELQANRLLRDAEVAGPPVPTTLISDLSGVSVDYWPRTPVSGSTHWTGSTWIIVVNADEPRVRQRFSLAHELHHILDHPSRDILYKTTRRGARPTEEVVADHFAACLLMPKRWVRRALISEGVTNVPALASLFEVSRIAMRTRLDFLGLSDDAIEQEAA